MLLESIWIGAAYMLGLLSRFVNLPPLVGYLLAGFLISYLIPIVGVNPEESASAKTTLHHISHLGVILLLFTVGLKLNLKNIFRFEIFGPGLLHFLGISSFYGLIAFYTFDLDLHTSLYLAIALSFSSTVLSAKGLEAKKELSSFHGKVAVGILILQDIIALIVMSISGGQLASPLALGLLLLIPLRPLLYRLMDHSGKGELFMLLGVFMAVSLGAFAFEYVGLSAELGALILGMLVAKHPRSGELSKSLWAIKEIFLVGFFLKVGLAGLPTTQDWLFAFAFAATLPLKGILFFVLLIVFKLRARSSFLSSLSLTAFSEFGLIVANLVLPEWLTPLALCLTLSFIISAPLNQFSHQIYERIYKFINHLERNTRHPDEQTIYLGDAEVVIIGLGRTGNAAYNQLITQGNNKIAGIDSNPDKVNFFKEEKKLNAYFGDAEDPLFWEKLNLGNVTSVLLCIGEIEAKVEATKKLRARNFTGTIAAHCLDEGESKSLKRMGADHTLLTLNSAGVGLAKCLKGE